MRSASTFGCGFAVGVAAAVLIAGCGSDGGGPDARADVTATDTAAPSDVDEATPDAADTTGANDFCRDDDDCKGAGEICSCEGHCVVPIGDACTEDRNCGIPNWCNPCTGHCEPQAQLCEPCTLSRGCRDLGQCLPYQSGGSYCGLACVTNAGCPTGYMCLDIPGAEKQCVARSGTCVDLGLCSADRECPFGQVCNAQSRTCGPGCTEDGQCQQGTVCVFGRCVPPCGGDGDCTPPATCQGGKCKIPGACESPNDCPTPATWCDRVTGQCVAGCQIDDDCRDAAKTCKAGSCIDKGCRHNYECAFGRVCDKAQGQCIPYPTSEPHCATCDAQASNSPACPDPNICVTFQDDHQQPLGDFCLVPCKHDPIDRCPSGWQCQRFEDPQGGPEQFYCVRPCHVTPVTPP